MIAHLLSRPSAWLGIAISVTGAAVLISSRRGLLDGRAFLGSCALITGVLAAAGAAMYPVFLRSTLSPAFDLDALHQPRNNIAMHFALGWWPFAFALAVSYFVNVFRANRARVSPGEY